MATQSHQADAMAQDSGIDAIELLTQDHQNVKELFE